MGKIFDALQKAGSAAVREESSRNEPERAAGLDQAQIDDSESIESLLLKPHGSGSGTAERAFQIRPPNELLVCVRQNGNREVDFAAEQYKMLRTQLLFPASGKVPRSIMVTSAIPGEGKSVVASNLAISIALGKHEHTLLIECDLRRPSLARIFGIETSKGLADYLLEEEELSNLFFKTSVDRLTLLPAGRSTRNPYELLSSRRMLDLLEEVRNRYQDRFIILDSTPAQVAAETGVLTRFIDGVILVVRHGKSSRKVIEESIETIGKEKIVGVVFNAFEGTYSNEYYYKYYGSNHKKRLNIFSRD